MILEADDIPNNEFNRRLSLLQNELIKNDLSFVLIQYKSDLYYYTRTGQSCILAVPNDGEPILFARRELKRIKEETIIENIAPIKRTKEILPFLKESNFDLTDVKYGLEGDVLPADIYNKFTKLFPNSQAVSIGRILRLIRSIKSKYEIDRIKEASKMLDSIHEHMFDIMKPGMTEVEVSGLIYAEMRKMGAESGVRSRDFYTEAGGTGMVLSGTNSGVMSYTLTATAGPGLHHSNPWGPSKKKIHEGEMVLIDLSLAYKGYISDETRNYVIGRASDKIKERYNLAWECEKTVAELMKKGNKVSEVYEKAYEKAQELGVAKQMMLGGEIPFLAHGVGLELNDLPVIVKNMDYTLEKGNVLAVEPKLIYPYEMTIGPEDTYVITEKGAEALTHAPHLIVEY